MQHSGEGGVTVAIRPIPRYGPAMPDGVVYVVDDEECVRRAFCRLLSSAGLRAEGLHRLRRSSRNREWSDRPV